MRIDKIALWCGISVLGSMASAATVPITLYNTGVDVMGTPQANQTTDTHWLLNPTGANTETAANTSPTVITSAFGFPIPPWLGDNTTSAWLVPNSSATGPNDNAGNPGFIYSEAFTTAGDGTVSIAANVAADNGVTGIAIDGGPTQSVSANGFSALVPTSITQDVTGLTHVVQFYVMNGVGENPGGKTPDGLTGFRAEFSSATFSPATPEPASLSLLGLAGGAMLIRRRRSV